MKLLKGPKNAAGKKTKTAKGRVAYNRTWTRGDGADPQIYVQISTEAIANEPIEDPGLIELMVYLKRNGWQKIEAI